MGKAGETKQKNAFANLSGQISKGRGKYPSVKQLSGPRPMVDLSVVSLILSKFSLTIVGSFFRHLSR